MGTKAENENLMSLQTKWLPIRPWHRKHNW